MMFQIGLSSAQISHSSKKKKTKKVKHYCKITREKSSSCSRFKMKMKSVNQICSTYCNKITNRSKKLKKMVIKGRKLVIKRRKKNQILPMIMLAADKT